MKDEYGKRYTKKRAMYRRSIARMLNLARQYEYEAYQTELLGQHEKAEAMRNEANDWRKMAYIIKEKYMEIRGWEKEWLK